MQALGRLFGDGTGGGGVSQRSHRHFLKCPVCNFQHRDVTNRNGNFTPQTQHVCSHGGRVIFMKQDCPICWEEIEPLVAFPCGHGVCKPCFQQLGGRTGRAVERAARGEVARAASSGDARRNAASYSDLFLGISDEEFSLENSDLEDYPVNARDSRNPWNNPIRPPRRIIRPNPILRSMIDSESDEESFLSAARPSLRLSRNQNRGLSRADDGSSEAGSRRRQMRPIPLRPQARNQA